MTEFKLGEEVLIPGKILKVMSSEAVIVETTSGSIIIARSCDLGAVRANPERRIEALARVMCAADAVDPDGKAASIGQPLFVSGGYVIMSTTFEAWRLYAKYAQALIDKGLA